MQILVLNSGSTSLKYKVFDEKLRVLKGGRTENIGLEKIKNHEQALKLVLKEIKSDKIEAVGHRVVHGGGDFLEPVVVTTRVLKRLEKYSLLAPLHNPANILGIKASMKLLPRIPNMACFDTSFFKNLPKKAKIYALPFKFYKKYDIRRFGFHGLSHQYAAEVATKKLKKPLSKLKLITCHLGGGSSIAAVRNGRPIDTSMGFTPMEGLVMMTRSGDIDPGIIIELVKSSKFKVKSYNNVDYLLNYESGMKGLSGVSEDMKEILKAAKKGNKRAKLALEIYCYRIKKYIGAYFAILGGLDALIFTGAIGYGSRIIRNMVTKDLSVLKRVKILSIESNEELMIAREVLKCYHKLN